MKCVLTIKKLLFAFILFSLFLVSKNIVASHAMGADLTYECLGGNDYKITLKFYRDCSGISAPAPPTLDLNSLSCGQNLTLNLVQVVGPNLVPTVCASQTSSCQGGTLYGAEEYIYEAVTNLPATCQDWVVSYKLCCRNGAITTVTNASNYKLYIETSIDNSSSLCNDTPVFGSLPILVACVGEELNYNHGVYETEGDSLEFSLVSGLDDTSAPLPYAASLSGSNPLFSSTPITINSLTGAISITPSIAQVGVISVLVEEYRNGVKIGDVTRDIQISVVDCMGNSAPIVSGINGTAGPTGTTGNYNMLITPGNSFCFNLATFDAEGDNITMTSVIPPGSTFNFNPSPTNAATFCWSPTIADIGTHLLTITAEDDGCTFIAKNSFVYAIKVTNSAPPCELTGKVNYWNDANRILAGLTGNNNTEIYASNSTCGFMVPATTPTIVDANGEFIHDMSNGSFLHINRDVDNTNCSPSWGVIEANDAFLANVFANADPNFTPNPYQVIAMDVDMNGVVDSLDANQILDRSLSSICEFSQAWMTPVSGSAKDWLFTDMNTAAGLDYTISSNFPAPDSTGYSNISVPDVPVCLDADAASNCFPADVLTVQACLLGDVDGNWDSVVDAPIFFTNTPYDFLINLDLATAEYVNGQCVFTIEVNAGLPSSLKSFNFDIDYNEANVNLINVISGNSMSTNGRLKWNNSNPDKTLVGAFANQYNGFVPSGPVFSLQLTSVNGTISPADIGVIRVRKNGSAADMLIEGMAAGCTSSNTDVIRQSIKISPNPATQSTIINYQSFQNEIEEITLWNTQGQLLRALDISPSGQTELQLSEFPSGVYILRLNDYGYRLLVVD